MNTEHELDQIVSGWLEARTVDPPHGSLASALAKADQTPQQRHRWLQWWFDRGRGATGGAAAHGRDDPPDRRKRLMFSATIATTTVVIIALVAALGLNVDQSQPIVPAGGGTVHYVAEDGDFSTIGEAVAAAADGDTVLVAPGSYEEALIIDKDITLAGEEVEGRATLLLVPEDAPDPVMPISPTDPRADSFTLPERVPVGVQVIETDATLRNLEVIGQGDSIALLVHGGAPSLEDLTLKHQGAPLTELKLAGGLFIEGGSQATAEDIEVWYRVRIGDGSTPTFRRSGFAELRLVVQDESAPVFADSNFGGSCGCDDGVVLGGSASTFRDSDFSSMGLDIIGHAGDGTSALLEGNRFASHEAEALAVLHGATATISGNKFYGNQQAMRVEGATAEIRDNELVSNYTGVLLKDAEMTLAANKIRGGNIGVSVISSGSPLITDNLIENVDTMGVFAANGTSPTIEGNTICGSTKNLMVAPEAHPTVGQNEICPDREVAGG